MTPLRAPSAAVPGWAFAAAVIMLAAVAWWGIARPLRRARRPGTRGPYDRPYPARAIVLPAVGGGAAAAALIALAATVARRPMGGVDATVQAWMAGHRSPPLTAVMVVVTNLGSPFGTATMLIVLAAWAARRHRSWFPPLLLLLPACTVGAANTGIKYLLGRVRPPLAGQVVLTTDPSFPSGHMAWAVAGWGAIAALLLWNGTRPPLVLLCAIPPLLIGASRLYLGVHHPTDLLAASLLATAGLALATALSRLLLDRRSRQFGAAAEFPLPPRGY